VFGEERQALYSELADVVVEQGKIDEGYSVAEQAKARTLLSLIEARRTAKPRQPTGSDEVLRELARSVATWRTQLLSASISPSQRADVLREIEAAETAMAEGYAKAEMGRRSAWFRPVSVERVQKQLYPGQDCVLEFFLGEKRSFVWLITSDSVSLEALPARQEIEKAVRDYLATINTKPNNLYLERRLATQQEMAEKLFRLLLERMAGRLAKGKRLIIVPDGILNYLPFEALRHEGSYLIEDHDISYLPSSGLLELLRAPSGQSEVEDKLDLLAFGDPVFSPKGTKRKSAGDGMDAGRQALHTAEGFRLDALPRTRDEVEEIARLFPPDRRGVFLGQASTEEAVKAAPLRRYRRLHFATHSLINERTPSRSAIVLTQDSDPQEDGFLEVGEIAELDLDCDLVVLSACQTGRGKLFSGEGVVGLSRAFLYAGARSVVVSLWNVSDISTGVLMKNFYQHMVSSMNTASALRAAKLQMLRSNNETRHPYYWAPFILVGRS
jgi:CHAT domain-containing protein